MAIASPGTISNIKVGNYRVTWNSVVLGITAAGSEITIEKVTRESTGDQYGQTVLKEYLIGEKVSVALVLKEFTATNLSKAMVGSTLTSALVEDGVQYAGSVELSALAQLLTLHPLDTDDGTLTYDWNFYKATPRISGAIPGKAEEDLIIPVMFKVFPDTSKAIGKQLYKYGA